MSDRTASVLMAAASRLAAATAPRGPAGTQVSYATVESMAAGTVTASVAGEPVTVKRTAALDAAKKGDRVVIVTSGALPIAVGIVSK